MYAKVYLKLDLDKIVVVSTHDNGDSVFKIKKLLSYQQIKKYAINTTYSLNNIYNLVIKDLSFRDYKKGKCL